MAHRHCIPHPVDWVTSIHQNVTHMLSIEMEATMAIMMGYSRKGKYQKEDTLRAYSSMQARYWLYPLHKNMIGSQRTEDTLTGHQLPWIPEVPIMKDYFKMYSPDGIGGIDKHRNYTQDYQLLDYSGFPIYGDRLCSLRE